MREGFGGVFMMGLMMVFIVVFVSFLAIALNYAKTFRVKNGIINIIEQYQGFNEDTRGKLEDEGYLLKMNYRLGELPRGKSASSTVSLKSVGDQYCSQDYGYCVTLRGKEGNRSYYLVETYFLFELPNFIGVKDMMFAIRGETTSIVTS